MSSPETTGKPPQPPAAAGATSATESVKQRRKKKKDAIRYPFWFGGSASSMAACVTHPLDLLKVRLQTRKPDGPKGMSGTFLHIIRTDGPLGLYNGLSAALLRQLTYSTVRFGVYEEMKTRATRSQGEPSPPLLVAMAAASGFVGGVVGNFADVVNVRMQQDASLPAAERRNYRHAVDGVVRMAREEGASSWFRGWTANSSRAAAMTASQLASYDTFKGWLLRYTPMGDTLTTHFSASFLAGLTAATVTSPIDVIKTRIMSSTSKDSFVKIIRDIYKAEGIGWMFRGWVPSFLRLGPHTICTFIFLEMHRKTYRRAKGLQEPAM